MKELKGKYDAKFEDDDIIESLNDVVCNEIPIEKLKIPKFRATKKKVMKKVEAKIVTDILVEPVVDVISN